jgi:hypothetical protein
MPIVSTQDTISVQPRLEGHSFSVAHVVANVNYQGLERYLANNDLKQEAGPVKSAIQYCMNQVCVDSAVSYCYGCNKSKEYPGKDLWKTAKRIYNEVFLKP